MDRVLTKEEQTIIAEYMDYVKQRDSVQFDNSWDYRSWVNRYATKYRKFLETASQEDKDVFNSRKWEVFET